MANREYNSNETRAGLVPALFVAVLVAAFVLMNVQSEIVEPALLGALFGSGDVSAVGGSLAVGDGFAVGDVSAVGDASLAAASSAVGDGSLAAASSAYGEVSVMVQIAFEAALALIALVAVKVAVPRALRWGGLPKRKAKEAPCQPDAQDASAQRSVRQTLVQQSANGVQEGCRSKPARIGKSFVVAMLVVAFVGGCCSIACAFAAETNSLSVGSYAEVLLQGFQLALAQFACAIGSGPTSGLLVLALVALALFTGVFEEAFMRVLGMEAFASGLVDRGIDARRALLLAAVATSALFALLHIGAPSADANVAGWLQVAGRFVQTGLFGFCMAGLYVQSRSLWPCALLHAGFNLLYLNALPLIPDHMVSYGSGSPEVSLLLVATIVLMVPMAIKSYRVLCDAATH